MKNLILPVAVVLSMVAIPALAQTETSGDSTSAASITKDQRNALVAILSGLPRQ